MACASCTTIAAFAAFFTYVLDTFLPIYNLHNLADRACAHRALTAYSTHRKCEAVRHCHFLVTRHKKWALGRYRSIVRIFMVVPGHVRLYWASDCRHRVMRINHNPSLGMSRNTRLPTPPMSPFKSICQMPIAMLTSIEVNTPACCSRLSSLHYHTAPLWIPSLRNTA